MSSERMAQQLVLEIERHLTFHHENQVDAFVLCYPDHNRSSTKSVILHNIAIGVTFYVANNLTLFLSSGSQNPMIDCEAREAKIENTRVNKIVFYLHVRTYKSNFDKTILNVLIIKYSRVILLNKFLKHM